jgi:hypothetical protein
MKYIDQNFLNQELQFTGNGYLPFIEWSVSEIVKVNSSLNICVNSTPEFWLFSYIKNNFRSTLSQFCNFYDIENDVLGFPTAQRELRHSIEAYLDLYNYVHYEDYKQVLLYCSNSNKMKRHEIELGDYRRFCHNHEFTILSKYKISELDKEELLDWAKGANSYTHPDVYLDLNTINSNKEELLRNLIVTNVYLTSESYELFLEGIRNKGADISLCNVNEEVQINPYSYRNWYDNKKANLNSFVQGPLFVSQSMPMSLNYHFQQ